MTDLWLGSGLGLVLGWIFQRAGLARPHTLKEALGMRQRSLWRMLLIALGTATVCVAFLGWLAVLDVDHLEILPLNGTLVVGSLILGRPWVSRAIPLEACWRSWAAASRWPGCARWLVG